MKNSGLIGIIKMALILGLTNTIIILVASPNSFGIGHKLGISIFLGFILGIALGWMGFGSYGVFCHFIGLTSLGDSISGIANDIRYEHIQKSASLFNRRLMVAYIVAFDIVLLLLMFWWFAGLGGRIAKHWPQ